MGVTSYEETLDVSCMTVTPACSKGALGTWRSQGVLGLSAEIRLLEMRGRGCGQTSEGGVYVCQCLSFAARLGRPAKESQGQNRTGEIPPSGIAGGLAETSPLWEPD